MVAISRGFTLIELMIVVAILGILAAIAIPAYQDYLARSQVTEAVQLVGGGKTPLSEFYADKGRWPTTADSVMGSLTGSYVDTVALTGAVGATGQIQVVATMKSVNVSNQLAGATLVLSSGDGVNWSCSGGTILPRFRPMACKP